MKIYSFYFERSGESLLCFLSWFISIVVSLYGSKVKWESKAIKKFKEQIILRELFPSFLQPIIFKSLLEAGKDSP